MTALKPGRELDVALAKKMGWEELSHGQPLQTSHMIPPGFPMQVSSLRPIPAFLTSEGQEALKLWLRENGYCYRIMWDGESYSTAVWADVTHFAPLDYKTEAGSLTRAAMVGISNRHRRLDF